MFPSFSIWSWIVNHCASSSEDLLAAPPGSPLALPLIYSLIHLCCCHMAPPPPPPLPLPSSSPSLLPSLPLLISQSCSSWGPLNQGIPLHFPLPLSHPLFFFSFFSLLSLSASPLCCNRAPCLLRLCCSSLPRSAQIRSCHRQRLMYP